jgi:hypothetical protein
LPPRGTADTARSTGDLNGNGNGQGNCQGQGNCNCNCRCAGLKARTAGRVTHQAPGYNEALKGMKWTV